MTTEVRRYTGPRRRHTPTKWDNIKRRWRNAVWWTKMAWHFAFPPMGKLVKRRRLLFVPCHGKVIRLMLIGVAAKIADYEYSIVSHEGDEITRLRTIEVETAIAFVRREIGLRPTNIGMRGDTTRNMLTYAY